MNIHRLDPGERQDNDDCQQRQRSGHRGWPAILRTAPESQVRSRLPAGGGSQERTRLRNKSIPGDSRR